MGSLFGYLFIPVCIPSFPSNLCWSKISLWENWGSPEEHEQKVKTRMGNQVGNTDKKATTTSKNAETKEHENIFERSEKSTIRKKNTTRRNESENTSESRKTKKIPKQD